MIFLFDRFQADDIAFRLTADGRPVSLEPKALRLLLYLIQNRGRLVRKQELLDAVWADAAVTESALTRSIGLLRKTLDDDSRDPRFIETVPTAGYRFIANVETSSTPEIATAAARSVPPLASEPTPRRHRLRLATIIAACLCILVIATWRIAARSHPAPIRSLAVLPLDNLSGDPTQEYFADGMTDELITQIARIPNLASFPADLSWPTRMGAVRLPTLPGSSMSMQSSKAPSSVLEIASGSLPSSSMPVRTAIFGLNLSKEPPGMCFLSRTASPSGSPPRRVSYSSPRRRARPSILPLTMPTSVVAISLISRTSATAWNPSSGPLTSIPIMPPPTPATLPLSTPLLRSGSAHRKSLCPKRSLPLSAPSS